MDSLEYLRSALLVATNRIYDIIVADVTTEYSKNDTVYLISSISLLEDNGSATISRYEKSSLNTNLYLHLGSCFYLLYNPKEKTNCLLAIKNILDYLDNYNSNLKNYEIPRDMTFDEFIEYYYKRKKELELKKHKENLIKSIKTDYQKLIKQKEESIDYHYNQIMNLKEDIIYLYGQQALHDNEGVEESNSIINFLTRSRLIDRFKITSNNKIEIITTLLDIAVTYGESEVDRILNTYKGNYTNIANAQFIADIFKDALTTRERYISKVSPYHITIIIRENDIDYLISKCSHTFYGNSHWERYQCLGSFKADIAKARSEKNIIGLICILLQYLQTINLQDLAGTKWLYDDIHFIYDKIEQNYVQCHLGSTTINRITTPISTNYIKEEGWIYNGN